MGRVDDSRERLLKALTDAEQAAGEWYLIVRAEARDRLGTETRAVVVDDAVSRARSIYLNLVDAVEETKRGASS